MVSIELELSESHKSPPSHANAGRNGDPEDDLRTLLSDVCEALEEADVGFVVDGFGERWPVDVSTDLAVLLEQLPDVIEALAQRLPFQISFYEQGIERVISVSIEGEMARLHCVSGTSWQPMPMEELMPRAVLADQLVRLRNDFCLVVRNLCPWAVEHPWMSELCCPCVVALENPSTV